MNLQRILKNVKTPGQVFKVGGSILISVGLILFTGFVAIDTLESFSDAYQKAKIVEAEKAKVDNLRLENLRKQQELGYVLGNQYVEDEARTKFNYVKKGEVIFVLPQTDDVEIKDNTVSEKKPETRPIADWITLLLN